MKVHLNSSKFIQVHNLNPENAALILRSGQGRLLTGYNRLLHTIDLNQIGKTIKTLEELIEKLNASGDFSKIINYKINVLRNTYFTLLPKHPRTKRSIEILGSTIKFITGNLDAHDLQIINKNIEAIKENNNQLIKEANNQIIINQSFQNYMNNVTEEIKNMKITY